MLVHWWKLSQTLFPRNRSDFKMNPGVLVEVYTVQSISPSVFLASHILIRDLWIDSDNEFCHFSTACKSQ